MNWARILAFVTAWLGTASLWPRTFSHQRLFAESRKELDEDHRLGPGPAFLGWPSMSRASFLHAQPRSRPRRSQRIEAPQYAGPRRTRHKQPLSPIRSELR
jgi:hypothetical protein